MWAAAKGHSTLGIPKSVGKEFVGADEAIRRAAGIAFVLPTGEALFIKRSGQGDHAGEWCFPGGGAEGDESPEQTARREAAEETGMAPKQDVDLIGNTIDEEGVHFLTFRQNVGERFDPTLNDESTEAEWRKLDDPPNPLHPGVAVVLRNMAMDARLAFDRVLPGLLMASTAHGLRVRTGLAFDRAAASVRSYRKDGALDVAATNISKACVNPYVGHEIPGWQELGLNPDEIYNLLRDPEELKKAAPTFNRLPILSEHVAVTADDHQPDLVVGATGSDCEFAAPFLRNSLVLWARDGIDLVESDEQKELSCAYHYRADMTPGSYEGEAYDGVMRDIVGNHVALVKQGRAGADVVVGDSMEIVLMASKSQKFSHIASVSLGALAVFLQPKLAMDSKIDISPTLVGLTSKNFKEKKPEIVAALTKLTDGKLAKDASIEGLAELLDKLEVVKDASGDPANLDPGAALPIVGEGPEEETMDAADPDAAKEFLKGKLSAEDMKAYDDLCAAKKPGMDADETDEEKKAREKKEADDKTAKDAAEAKEKDMVTKPAMDAAIKVATDKVLADQRALRDAEEAVRPYVGKLAMAHDSAEAVYRTALGALGVKTKGIDALPLPALQAILEAQPRADARKKEQPLAMDAAGGADFDKRFPGAAKITIAG